MADNALSSFLAPVNELSDKDNVRLVLYTGTQMAHVPLDEVFKFLPKQPDETPSGTVITFAGGKAPDGYLACDGTAINRTEYADLFSVLGETWGKGDGSTTFNLPDFQNMFLRGMSADRAVGSKQEDAIRNITGGIQFGTVDGIGAVATTTGGFKKATQAIEPMAATLISFDFDASRVTQTAEENRPVNMAVLYCIKI